MTRRTAFWSLLAPFAIQRLVDDTALIKRPNYEVQPFGLGRIGVDISYLVIKSSGGPVSIGSSRHGGALIERHSSLIWVSQSPQCFVDITKLYVTNHGPDDAFISVEFGYR